MKVVIAGAGNVGLYLAADLLHGGHEVLLMEIDPDVAKRGAGVGVQWMVTGCLRGLGARRRRAVYRRRRRGGDW